MTIREAIAATDKVALARLISTTREHVIALEPRGKGLMGTLLRYPYEVRDEKDYFADIPNIKIDKEMLDLAKHIVQTKSGHFDPEKFEDHYEKALRDMIKRKVAGKEITAPKPVEHRTSSISWTRSNAASLPSAGTKHAASSGKHRRLVEQVQPSALAKLPRRCERRARPKPP